MNFSSKNTNSLAYSCGLVRNSKSTTLNPNLNIEDEYVQNLLKQIQFLGLEARLLRQKQSCPKGPGLMSLINKQNRPVVDHLLISGDKYKDMRNDLLGKANTLTIHSIELEGDERALIKRRDYIDKKRKEAEDKNKEQRKKWDDIIGDLETRFRAERTRQDELQKENLRLTKNHQFSEGELEKISQNTDNSTILAQTQSRKLDKEQKLEQQDQEKKLSIIAKTKGEINKFNQKLQNDAKYKEIEQENQKLSKQYEDQQKQLSQLHFKLIQTEHIFKLAEVERDREIKDRRAAQQQLETTEILYKQVVKANEAKIDKRKKSRVNDSVELKKGQVAISKLEKELTDCRRRNDKAVETYNKYKVQHKTFLIQQLKYQAKKLKLEETYAKLIKDNSILDIQKQELEKYINGVEKQLEKLKKDSIRWSAMQTEAQELYTQLYERFQFLQGSVTLQQQIKKVNVEDLRSVVQKNIDVNNTVMELMNKWTDIQNFGRA